MPGYFMFFFVFVILGTIETIISRLIGCKITVSYGFTLN